MEAYASPGRGLRIDAFAVGVSLAFMFTKAHMAFAILSIGVVTGLFSAAGLHIGRAFGSRWQKPGARSPAAWC